MSIFDFLLIALLSSFFTLIGLAIIFYFKFDDFLDYIFVRFTDYSIYLKNQYNQDPNKK